MMKKRDLKADLELCNKATPGPWKEQGTSIGIDSTVLYHRTNKKKRGQYSKKGVTPKQSYFSEMRLSIQTQRYKFWKCSISSDR